MTWLANIHCKVAGHRWQPVGGTTCQVCLRCGVNGWIVPKNGGRPVTGVRP